MNLLLIVFGIVLLLVIIVYLIYVAIKKEEPEEQRPVIHTSGIYSVVRRSPRGMLHPAKPTQEEVVAHLASSSNDISGKALTNEDRQALAEEWKNALDHNVTVIENGDKKGLEIYFYKCQVGCSQNKSLRENDQYVTREELYQHPELIPPLHIGCQCTLVPDQEWKTGGHQDTQSMPLLHEAAFQTPDWKIIERTENA